MKINLLVLLATCALALASSCLADGIFYIRPDAGGRKDGSDWNNAYTAPPKAMQRGSIYYVADGNYAKHSFDAPEASTQAITIKKATDADHGTDDGWNPAYGDGVAEFPGLTFNTDWWILDGAGRKIPESGCGLRLSSTTDLSTLVTLDGKRSHITIRNVELAGDTTLEKRITGIYGVQGPSHLEIQHCHIHDLFGVPFHFIDATDILIEFCLIARTKSTPEWHTAGIQARGCTALTVRYNKWEDINGTAVIVSGSGNSSRWNVHGNIFLRGNVGHGMVADNDWDTIEDVQVSGNIIVGHRGNAGMNFFKSKGRITIVDNVWYDNPWISFSGVTTQDYNHYSNCKFPFAFQPAPHETPVRRGEDANYSIVKTSPFSDLAKGDFSLSRDVLRAITHEKK